MTKYISLVAVTALLNGCMVKYRCPIEVPVSWANPPYYVLDRKFYDCPPNVCVTRDDAIKYIQNQVMCDEIRRGLVDMIERIQ